MAPSPPPHPPHLPPVSLFANDAENQRFYADVSKEVTAIMKESSAVTQRLKQVGDEILASDDTMPTNEYSKLYHQYVTLLKETQDLHKAFQALSAARSYAADTMHQKTERTLAREERNRPPTQARIREADERDLAYVRQLERLVTEILSDSWGGRTLQSHYVMRLAFSFVHAFRYIDHLSQPNRYFQALAQLLQVVKDQDRGAITTAEDEGFFGEQSVGLNLYELMLYVLLTSHFPGSADKMAEWDDSMYAKRRIHNAKKLISTIQDLGMPCIISPRFPKWVNEQTQDFHKFVKEEVPSSSYYPQYLAVVKKAMDYCVVSKTMKKLRWSRKVKSYLESIREQVDTPSRLTESKFKELTRGRIGYEPNKTGEIKTLSMAHHRAREKLAMRLKGETLPPHLASSS